MYLPTPLPSSRIERFEGKTVVRTIALVSFPENSRKYSATDFFHKRTNAAIIDYVSIYLAVHREDGVFSIFGKKKLFRKRNKRRVRRRLNINGTGILGEWFAALNVIASYCAGARGKTVYKKIVIKKKKPITT